MSAAKQRAQTQLMMPVLLIAGGFLLTEFISVSLLFPGRGDVVLTVLGSNLLMIVAMLTIAWRWYQRQLEKPLSELLHVLALVKEGHTAVRTPTNSSAILTPLYPAMDTLIDALAVQQSELEQLRKDQADLQEILEQQPPKVSTPLPLKDPVTGLGHARIFPLLLDKAIHRAHRELHRLAAIRIRLVNLDAIAALHGKKTADTVLRVLSSRLAGLLRRQDAAFRLAEQELAILLPSISDDGGVNTVIYKLKDALETPVAVEDLMYRLNLEFQSALYPDTAHNLDEMLQAIGFATPIEEQTEAA